MKEQPDASAYTLHIKGSDKYADLEMLQSVLLEPLAEALAIVIREKARKGERLLEPHPVGGKQDTGPH